MDSIIDHTLSLLINNIYELIIYDYFILLYLDVIIKALKKRRMIELKKIKNYIPGVIVALVIAAIAKFIEGLLPIHLIGASVIALFIGMFLNSYWKPASLKPGLKFTSKKILKFAIVLLGASLSIGTILNVGKLSLTVMLFTLLTCFGGGYFIGKALGLDWKLSNLISAGTGICGGSAIAAIAPVIDADDTDIAYAMSATFLFDMAMIVLFPIMGHALGLSDMAYGLWAGTAVNDTSSVVAAGYAFSEGAGDFATMVKLTRTLAIIPTVLVFTFVNLHVQRKNISRQKVLNHLNNKATKYEVNQLDQIGQAAEPEKKTTNFFSLFPWFIAGFLALAILNSLHLFPAEFSLFAKDFSKFLMVAALAAIGMNTEFKDMKKAGFSPMLHGFIISLLVVVVAILVEFMIGIV